MSTTLEDEMEESAKLYDADAARALAANDGASIAYAAARASHFRQRAAWVREMAKLRPSSGLANMLSGFNDGFAYDLWSRFRGEFIAALTGPIPAAETAPTERKEP